ncbi:MAG: carboxylesterase family protein, partial [Gammaproteobacteria bacterium]|nr:carboxylesterase family protein [Gammaproteobacteria bacterium]
MLFVLLVACRAEEAQPESVDPNVVTTTSGPVRGETVDGVRVFRGIPFASPPVGDLRWKPPAPTTAWSEPRDALDFGTPCWQPRLEGFYSRGAIDRSEDCLYLNVWTRATAGDALPVMVWIHGGALQIGHGH